MLTLAASLILLDFTVWDNDGLYALVTAVALTFTAVLIVAVVRQTRAPGREDAARARAQAAIERRRRQQSGE